MSFEETELGLPAGIPLGSASLLLEYLGIDEPEEIDIEAVAQACNATVVYEPLEGCEARIVGAHDRAVITVNESAPRARQRFSAAHELGHWVHDRGKVAFACAEGQFVGEWGAANPERRANRFAADLLLPRKMFKRRSRHKPVTFATVRQLAEQFETSLTATAIRLVELGSFPAMIVGHDRGRKRWAMQNHMVPQVLKPRDAVVPTGRPAPGPVEVRADRFIEHPDAVRYRVVEDRMRVGSLTLSLLWWQDEAQILAALSDADD